MEVPVVMWEVRFRWIGVIFLDDHAEVQDTQRSRLSNCMQNYFEQLKAGAPERRGCSRAPYAKFFQKATRDVLFLLLKSTRDNICLEF